MLHGLIFLYAYGLHLGESVSSYQYMVAGSYSFGQEITLDICIVRRSLHYGSTEATR